MKDMQPWSESLKSVQDWVISCKNTTENFDWLVAQTLCQNYSRQELFQRTIAVTASGISRWMCGAYCWPVSEFFAACKEPGQLRFSSKYSTSLLRNLPDECLKPRLLYLNLTSVTDMYRWIISIGALWLFSRYWDSIVLYLLSSFCT